MMNLEMAGADDFSWFRYGMKGEEYGNDKCSSSSSIGVDSSIDSDRSSRSSSETTDDASSSQANSSGTLNDLSEIMKQLPIKRGLSKFYDGKSESFASLSRVLSIEDLAKKSVPYSKRLKASKSYANGFCGSISYNPYAHPKAMVMKKRMRTASSCFARRKPAVPLLHQGVEW